jgi:hypothetical protein
MDGAVIDTTAENSEKNSQKLLFFVATSFDVLFFLGKKCIDMNMYMYIYTYIHMYIYTYICVYVCMYVCIYFLLCIVYLR